MNVTKAFCVELGRSVNITDARNAYFAQDKPRKRFVFHCSSPQCQSKGKVLIIGVNYDKIAEDDPKFKSPHFRSKDVKEHSQDCQWVIEEEASQSLSKANTKTDKAKRHSPVGDGYIQYFSFLDKSQHTTADEKHADDTLAEEGDSQINYATTMPLQRLLS